MSRVVVLAPLRPGARDAVLLFLAAGPPFDLARTSLTAHTVHLTDSEAVFVFEGPHAREELQRIVGDPGVWRSATAWRDYLAARPRLADEAFTWVREGGAAEA